MRIENLPITNEMPKDPEILIPVFNHPRGYPTRVVTLGGLANSIYDALEEKGVKVRMILRPEGSITFRKIGGGMPVDNTDHLEPPEADDWIEIGSSIVDRWVAESEREEVFFSTIAGLLEVIENETGLTGKTHPGTTGPGQGGNGV